MSLRWISLVSLLVVFLVPGVAVRAQGYGGGPDTVSCESRNMQRERCDVPWRDARIVRQTSDSRCVRGRSWGFDRRGIWVDQGCAAVFAEVGGRHNHNDAGYGGGWRPDPGWDSRFGVVCESQDYRYRFCAVDLGGAGRASVGRQISGTPCVEGRTWGWNRGGIWVDQGCAAEFAIDRRWR